MAALKLRVTWFHVLWLLPLLSADDTSPTCFKGLFRVVFASREQQQPGVALLRPLPVCVKKKTHYKQTNLRAL